MQNYLKWFLLIALLIPCWVIGIKYDIDLVVLHKTAEFLNSDYTRVYAQNGNLGRYFYGPFSLILIKPLGFFSYVFVKYFWLCLQTFCYFIFWNLLSQLYPFLKEKRFFWGWFLVWIVSINPIHNNFQSNNIQLMLATLLLGAECLTQSPSHRKQILGGILVTFAAGIKVFPGFLVGYYFLARNHNVRKGIVLGGLIVVLTPFLFLGYDKATFLYQGFYKNLTTYSAENSLTQTNDILCLPSLLARFNFPSTAINYGILVLSAIFCLWFFTSRLSAQAQRTEVHFLALAWSLSVLFNPSTRPHYFIFYVPAFCSLIELAPYWKNRAVFLLGLGITTLLIAFTAEGVVGRPLNEWLENKSVPTYGMLLLVFILILGIIKKQNGVTVPVSRAA